MSDISVKFVSSVYQINSSNGLSIFCEVHNDKTITLMTNKSLKEFKFISSKPEMVKSIAEMFLKAVELAEQASE